MSKITHKFHLLIAAVLVFTLTPSITPAAATVTGCPTAICALDNGVLHFGSGDGSTHQSYIPVENSINSRGLFNQPFYKSADGNWYKLTFSDYPLDMAIGSGTGGSNWTGGTVVDIDSQPMANQVIDYSGYTVTASGTNSNNQSWSKGYGVISVSGEFTINGVAVQVRHRYELALDASFVKATSVVRNISTTSQALDNVHVWVGTRDDFVGDSDRPKKRRGNLTASGGFEELTSRTQQAKALEITTDNEGALFYSTTDNTDMSYNQCCSFSTAFNTRPQDSISNRGADLIPGITTGFYDGSYAAVLSYGNMAPNQETEIVWFYAAGAIADLAAVSRAVASAAAPAVPAVTRNDQGVIVTWDAPRTTDPITNYSIRYRAVGGGETWTVVNRSPASTIRSETVTALDNTQRYEFQVAAWTTANTQGAVEAQGPWSESSVADILGSPYAPTGTTGQGGDRSAEISFTPAQTNGTETATVTNYEYWIGDPETWTALSPADTTTPITIPGLVNGRSYTIQIRAVNAWGAGPTATISNVRTLPVFSDAVLLETIQVGTAYSDDVVATSGVTYSLSGALPSGLSFNTASGRLSGTPSAAGPFTFSITATNSAGSVSRSFTLGTAEVLEGLQKPAPVVIPFPTFVTVPTYFGVEGTPVSIPISANGADFYEIDGPLPPGMRFDGASGILSGTPVTPGTYQVVVIARSAGGGTSATFPFVVSPKPLPPIPSLDPITLPDALVDSPYVTQNGSQLPVTILPNASSTGIDVKAQGWSLSLTASQEDGKAASLNSSGVLVIKERESLYVAGEGFKPFSEVRIYIFSNPQLLGTLTTSANGSFSGIFPIATNLEEGPHLLQVNGMSSLNELRSASIPAIFEKIKIAPPSQITPAPGSNPVGSRVTQLVIPFAFNRYSVGESQKAIIKSLTVKPGAKVRVTGYAEPTRKQPDIAISLDRALEVKFAVAKLIPRAKFNVSGAGPKKSKLCVAYKNKCVVVTITQS